VRGGATPASFAPLYDEAVIAAIARCPLPVVCGIGHHSDETLAQQFAAVPCSTPSAAAAVFTSQLRDHHLALLAAVQRCRERLEQARRGATEHAWTSWLLAIGTCSGAVVILNALHWRAAGQALVGAFAFGTIARRLWLRRSRALAHRDPRALRTISGVWQALQALEPRTLQARASCEIAEQSELLARCEATARRLLLTGTD
jgi:exodeoxyribonuclease VII large subunit